MLLLGMYLVTDVKLHNEVSFIDWNLRHWKRIQILRTWISINKISLLASSSFRIFFSATFFWAFSHFWLVCHICVKVCLACFFIYMLALLKFFFVFSCKIWIFRFTILMLFFFSFWIVKYVLNKSFIINDPFMLQYLICCYSCIWVNI